jgi:hypothetical protein
MTFATFRSSGKIPLVRDWLIMAVRGLTMSVEHCLSNCSDMLSKPLEALGFRLLIILVVVASLMGSKWKVGFKV